MAPLMVVGIGIIVLGAVILLFFPNRPGGEFTLPGGTKISSPKAGFPLVVFGASVAGWSAASPGSHPDSTVTAVAQASTPISGLSIPTMAPTSMGVLPSATSAA